MLSNENSTTTHAGATDACCTVPAAVIDAIGDNIEKNGGLITRARASKHLTDLLMLELERLLGDARGKPGHVDGVRIYSISDNAMATLEWLVAEIWANSSDLSDMVDALQNHMVPLANAAYDALKAGRAPA